VIAVAIATYVCGLMLSTVVMKREQEIHRLNDQLAAIVCIEQRNV
jgi:hypothetical protein